MRSTVNPAAVLGAAMAILVNAVPIEAMILCRKPSGVVVARDACKKKETRVDLSSTGYQVVDSTGQTVGRFAYYDAGFGSGNVLRRQGGTALAFAAGTSGFAITGVKFYHETTDCSDPRYIDDAANLIRTVQVPASGTSGYYMGDPIQQHTFVAYETDDGVGSCPPASTPSVPGFCCHPEGFPYAPAAGPAVSFDLSPFAPPFHLE